MASNQIPADSLQHCEALGELALSGELRSVQGVLPAALACRDPLRDERDLPPVQSDAGFAEPAPVADLAEVQGQAQAKRALIVAAAGSHNLLLFGPPGTGKTLLASRLPGILPPLDEQQALEVAA